MPQSGLRKTLIAWAFCREDMFLTIGVNASLPGASPGVDRLMPSHLRQQTFRSVYHAGFGGVRAFGILGELSVGRAGGCDEVRDRLPGYGDCRIRRLVRWFSGYSPGTAAG